MSTLSLKKVRYSEGKKELSYDFSQGKLYSIHNNDSSVNDDLKSLFKILAYFKLPQMGEFYWGDVNIRKLDPSAYRSNMITIISEGNVLLENMKVVNYLKYVTNNFQNLYLGNVEFMDYLELVYSLLEEFGFDKKRINSKIKTLDIMEKWKLKLVETLLKGSDVLIMYKTLDYYEEEFLNFCYTSLRQIVEKYKLCVITFTTKEKISNEMDHLINI